MAIITDFAVFFNAFPDVLCIFFQKNKIFLQIRLHFLDLYGSILFVTQCLVDKEVQENGKVRYLRQGRYLWYQGFSLSQTFQQNLEAERPSCKGSDRRYSPPCQRMYSVPPLRQGNPRDLSFPRDTLKAC